MSQEKSIKKHESVETISPSSLVKSTGVEEAQLALIEYTKKLLSSIYKVESVNLVQNEYLEIFSREASLLAVYIWKTAAEPNTNSFIVRDRPPLNLQTDGFVVMIKQPMPLDADILLHHQVQSIFLPSIAPYSTIRSLIKLVLEPYFNLSSLERTETSQASDDLGKGIPVARKKFSELEYSLLSLEESVSIPKVTLKNHPIICELVGNGVTDEDQLLKAMQTDERLRDSSFLNFLQNLVNTWTIAIKKCCEHANSPLMGSIMQEINLWTTLESVLEDIENQLQTTQVKISFLILRFSKRFHAALSFASETGLRETLDRVREYNQLFRDLPISDFMSARDFPSLEDAIRTNFNHILKRLRTSSYPVKRSIELIESFGPQFVERASKILQGRYLMICPFEEFETRVKNCEKCFLVWDENVRDFTAVARELTRKRGEKFMFIKVKSAHEEMQTRLEHLKKIRIVQEKFEKTIQDCCEESNSELEMSVKSVRSKLQNSLQLFKDTDCLNTSEEGTRQFINVEASYNDLIMDIEEQIIEKIRNLLKSAEDSKAIFNIFSLFNKLFVRPKIREAVREFQKTLLDDFEAKITKVNVKIKNITNAGFPLELTRIRNLPPLTSKIIISQQLVNQIESLKDKIGKVLGPGWEAYQIGESLNKLLTSAKSQLNTDTILKTWLNQVNLSKPKATGSLLFIQRDPEDSSKFHLRVSFDKVLIEYFQETFILHRFGIQLTHSLLNHAREAYMLYPFAIVLRESIQRVKEAEDKIQEYAIIESIIEIERANCRTSIKKVASLHWENFLHIPNSRSSFEKMSSGRETKNQMVISELSNLSRWLLGRVDQLISIYDSIMVQIDEIDRGDYSSKRVSSKIGKIEELAYEIQFSSTNSSQFLIQLNTMLRSVLTNKLKKELESWIEQVEQAYANENTDKFLKKSEFIKIEHEVLLQNKKIIMRPVETESIKAIFESLQNLINVVTDQRSISIIVLDKASPSFIIEKLPEELEDILERAYKLITIIGNDLHSYVIYWKSLEALWVVSPDNLVSKLKLNFEYWEEAFNEIRQARIHFEHISSHKRIAFSVFKHDQIREKISLRYEYWQNDLLSRFVEIAEPYLDDLQSNLLRSRKLLADNNSKTVKSWSTCIIIAEINKLEPEKAHWKKLLNSYKALSREIRKANIQLPEKWITFDQLEADMHSLNILIQECNDFIMANYHSIKNYLDEETLRFKKRTTDLIEIWQRNEEIRSTPSASSALPFLDQMSININKLFEESKYLLYARRAFDLPEFNITVLTALKEECREFKNIWDIVFGIQAEFESLKNRLWIETSMNAIKNGLENVRSMIISLSPKFRQYELVENLNDEIKNLRGTLSIISSLKSEVMTDRHWKLFFLQFPMEVKLLRNLSLKDLWNLDLKKNEKKINDLLTQAQGESALENYLLSVKSFWSGHKLEIASSKKKYWIIRNWEEILSKVMEHLNSLKSMQMSPFYMNFEDEATTLLQKLGKLYGIALIWADIQRQWLYLNGIFMTNQNIKDLVPLEAAEFSSMDLELATILQKARQSVSTLSALLIPNLENQLGLISNSLKKIHTGLRSFLKKKRQDYGRLYFLGDEDLLELIGSSKSVAVINLHIRKIFPSVASVKFKGTDSQITSIASFEHELIELNQVVDITHDFSDWIRSFEQAISDTLNSLYKDSLNFFKKKFGLDSKINATDLLSWVSKFPFQCLSLSLKTFWTKCIEEGISSRDTSGHMQKVFNLYDSIVTIFTKNLTSIPASLQILVLEGLLIETIHMRNLTKEFCNLQKLEPTDIKWLNCIRYYYDSSARVLTVKVLNTTYSYGFEYLGIYRPLVHTKLTTKCHLVLSEALRQGLGGSPFGAAGTGKTESVKALGNMVGKLTLVFNCDSNFNFKSLSNILEGICQIGAWVCFDEFNRLQGKILSAISQQIQEIQQNLLRNQNTDSISSIEYSKNEIKDVHTETGIFMTLNPTYKGRSSLPANLKSLFRSIAMSKPEKEEIASVMLYTKGFQESMPLSKKIIPFYKSCKEKLSIQTHYDFELRSLKSLLDCAGRIKRRLDSSMDEEQIILLAVEETVTPKLVDKDLEAFLEIKTNFFGEKQIQVDEEMLKSIRTNCELQGLSVLHPSYIGKLTELYMFLANYKGIMVVGPPFSGKTLARRILKRTLKDLKGISIVEYVIDPKAWDVNALFGTYDLFTQDWVDGTFTALLRKLNQQNQEDRNRVHWIIFDGDIDPEWAENLNSLLDDNSFLSLPTGERILLPSNVRIIFETVNLSNTTPATITRCSMIWFGSSALSFHGYFKKKSSELLEKLRYNKNNQDFVEALAALLGDSNITTIVQEVMEKIPSEMILPCPVHTSWYMFFKLMESHIISITQYREVEDVTYNKSTFETLIKNVIYESAYWSATLMLTGDNTDFKDKIKQEFIKAGFLDQVHESTDLTTHRLVYVNGNWLLTEPKKIDAKEHIDLLERNAVVQTKENMKYRQLVECFIKSKTPVLLCGPAGSGKTTLLLDTLRSMPSVDIVLMNCSSETSSYSLLQILEQNCNYDESLKQKKLSPIQAGRRLFVFCDEINLPSEDKYGVQPLLSLLKDLVEYGGFWKGSDWIVIENVQFLFACNPQTYKGRKSLPERFLTRISVMHIDLPSDDSLQTIYEKYFQAVLRNYKAYVSMSHLFSSASVEIFKGFQKKFTQTGFDHYVVSPRDLTRWLQGFYHCLKMCQLKSEDIIIKVWVAEGLRIFCDRLIDEGDKNWFRHLMSGVIESTFQNTIIVSDFDSKFVFSAWMSDSLQLVDKLQLMSHMQSVAKDFAEETSNPEPIIFDKFLDHMLRIDRVFRQKQGHMVLVGDDGIGKSLLCKFVCWMDGLKIAQISPHKKYKLSNFEDDLRDIILRCTCKNESVCFLLYDNQLLETSFLERMNTLLANSLIPGLFEPEELKNILQQFSDKRHLSKFNNNYGKLYEEFCSQISTNLHIILCLGTQCGVNISFSQSPALYNRCSIDWIGRWSKESYQTIALFYTEKIRTKVDHDDLSDSYINLSLAIVELFHSACDTCKFCFSLPHFLYFCRIFCNTYKKDSSELKETYQHIISVLKKLDTTKESTKQLKQDLFESQKKLDAKKQISNVKLEEMVRKQKEAEDREQASRKLVSVINEQEQEIKIKQDKVWKDLSEAMPAIEAAQKSVSNIKKQHLTELRSMQNPPEAIRMTMEAVCALLGTPASSWRSIQQVIRKDDFITNIVNFDGVDITPEKRQEMEVLYISQPNFNVETAERASKACGPLLEWVMALINYSRTLDLAEPLKIEIKNLEMQANENRFQGSVVNREIQDLNDIISSCKEEYSILISEIQEIKNSSALVKEKITKSEKLIEDLTSEQLRWEQTRSDFTTSRPSVLGNSLLSAAELTFSGPLDETTRRSLVESFKNKIQELTICVDPEFDFLQRNCSAKERREWADSGLNLDLNTLQNAYLALNAELCPLLIDPDKIIIQFLKKYIPHLKCTSFSDENYLKTVESCIRFGSTLLIEDAQYMDPIILKVLRKDVMNISGRNVIQLGSTQIDYSPSFRLFLATDDSSSKAYLMSWGRLSIINSYVSNTSLVGRILDDSILIMKPKMHFQILESSRSQETKKMEIINLEKDLLRILGSSDKDLLNDENLNRTLETLKVNVIALEQQKLKSAAFEKELNNTRSRLEPFAQLASEFFIIFERVSKVNGYYQFTLEWFRNLYRKSVSGLTLDENSAKVSSQKLLENLINAANLSLANSDYLALSLVACFLMEGYSLNKMEAFFKGDSTKFEIKSTVKVEDYSIETLFAIRQQKLGDLPSAASKYISRFSQAIVDDWLSYVTRDSENTVPICLCMEIDQDITDKIEKYAAKINQKIISIAAGTKESHDIFRQIYAAACAEGHWIIVKNVHFDITWIQKLETCALNITGNKSFRLFFSFERSLLPPVVLLRRSLVIYFEDKADFVQLLQSNVNFLFPNTIIKTKPLEKAKVFLALSWLHTYLKEISNLAPFVLTKKYPITDTDLQFASKLVSAWIELVAANKTNIFPELIPWQGIVNSLETIVYNAQIDDHQDQSKVGSAIQETMTADIFQTAKPFIKNNLRDLEIFLPESNKIQEFYTWAREFPIPPGDSWAVLPQEVIDHKLVGVAQQIIDTCLLTFN